MINKLENKWLAWRYKRKTGYACVHPEAWKREQMIHMGAGKMLWCTGCRQTWFV